MLNDIGFIVLLAIKHLVSQKANLTIPKYN